MAEENSVKSIADLALKADSAVGNVIKTDDGRTIVVRNERANFTDITLPNMADVAMPKLVTQHVKIQTTDSLINYVNRFKNPDTVLFADIVSDSIVAVLDYHREPGLLVPPTDQPKAMLGVHRATLHLPKSLEWQTWAANSGKLMKHVDFATFLEENSIDIVNPVGADLLELCRDLQAKGDYSFSSAIRMGDVTELEYSKKSDAASRGGMTMPTQVQLSIPVYFGEGNVSITAFMRRKIDDGALFLGFQLSRAENVRQDEFHRIVDHATDATGNITTVYGTPA
jgi:uncharacterized protein YfdQ (DUF2303 family)